MLLFLGRHASHINLKFTNSNIVVGEFQPLQYVNCNINPSTDGISCNKTIREG